MKKLTTEQLEEALKNFGTKELSLDDLDSVSGGYSYTINENDVNITFTQEEYETMKGYLTNPLAASMMKQYGLTADQLSTNMTLPLEQGQTVVNLLNLFF